MPVAGSRVGGPAASVERAAARRSGACAATCVSHRRRIHWILPPTWDFERAAVVSTMTVMKKCLVFGLLGLVLGGCSSSGGSPAASACSTSSLAVTVTGLPADVPAKVTVTGMAGSTQSISATQSLKLATDSYTITADAVTAPD